jgi:hypothetical protein
MVARPEKTTVWLGKKWVKRYLVLGLVVHICNPNYSGGRGRKVVSSRQAGAKLGRTCIKINKKKRAGDMAQVVECLPSILKALGSIPSTIKKKEGKRKIGLGKSTRLWGKRGKGEGDVKYTSGAFRTGWMSSSLSEDNGKGLL